MNQRIRASDFGRIDRLIGECRELGYDSDAWRSHLVAELDQLVGATVGTGLEIIGTGGNRMRMVRGVSRGWARDELRELWSKFVEHEDPLTDVVFAGVFRQLPQHRGLVTRTRSQLLSERAWRASEHYNEYRRPSEIDDCLYSCCVLPASGSVSRAIDVIAIHRAANEKPFGEWERRFVDEVHRRLRELIGVHLASGSEPAVFALSRRLMQTLALLLQGAGEKAIAGRLGLSRSTVHQYVLALYRHFGTTNRSEILARWIRLGPSLMLPADLSPRRGETLERVLRGESDREIAADLGLSIYTVREHVTALYRRFRVRSRAELIARWIRIDPAILEQVERQSQTGPRATALLPRERADRPMGAPSERAEERRPAHPKSRL